MPGLSARPPRCWRRLPITPRLDVIELGLASDDHKAQGLGWPCIGTQVAMLGIADARATLRVKIAPRGSTHASAAAEP